LILNLSRSARLCRRERLAVAAAALAAARPLGAGLAAGLAWRIG
jgi:hypothetical protein